MYVLCYVGYIICVIHNLEQTLQQIDKLSPMKSGYIGQSDFYLG